MPDRHQQHTDRPHGGQVCREPVDLAHLARFTLGNFDLEREVLGLFVGQAPVYLEQLKQAGSDRDWHEAAHALKGSAGAVGAWRVAERAAGAEALKSDHDTAKRCKAIKELAAALDEASAYIGGLFETA